MRIPIALVKVPIDEQLHYNKHAARTHLIFDCAFDEAAQKLAQPYLIPTFSVQFEPNWAK